jgi:L-amino acid N-acyltransferase YncA
MLRTATPADAPAICAIYGHYIRHTIVTFDEEPVPPEVMAARMAEPSPVPWLVLEEGGTIIGYAYAAPWRTRSAYRHTVESTVYLAPDAIGDGRGTLLYGRLIDLLREQDVHAVMGVIALPNDASVALHEKLGFRRTGLLPEVGRKFGRWIDVGYWQLVLQGPTPPPA